MSKYGKHHHDPECECDGKCKEGECDCAERHHGSGECGCGSCHSGPECNCGDDCDCGCGSHFQRRFRTKAEQIAELEAYLSELKLEVQAVEEILADLRE